jgi:tRNA dimethylallyltransferase
LRNVNSKLLVVIAGPTAVGKTDVAIRLAQHFNTEIVSADARQVYKELGIGVAKPDPDQLTQVKHHFISSHPMEKDYNAAAYGAEALSVINGLFESHEKVILVGGSGLYIKAVLEGFDDVPEVDKEIRTKITEEYKEKGLSWLRDEVKKRDPDYFEVVDRKNPHRLIRSLGLSMSTGKKMSDWQGRSKPKVNFDVVKIGLTLPTEELYRRIDSRVDRMIAHGLFEEAAKLYTHRELQALQTVGYREIFAFMDHSYDKAEAIRLLKRNTRHYAKRQMTWFRKDHEFVWFQPGQWNEIVNLVASS